MSIKNPIDLFDKDYFQNVKKVEQFLRKDSIKLKKILIEIEKLPTIDKKSLLKLNTFQLEVLAKPLLKNQYGQYLMNVLSE